MDTDRIRVSEAMSINCPSQRRRHVRWPLSVGAVVAQVAVSGLVVLGPAARTGVLACRTGDTRSVRPSEPLAEAVVDGAVPRPPADTSATDAPGRLVRSDGAGDPARPPPLPAAAARRLETGRVVPAAHPTGTDGGTGSSLAADVHDDDIGFDAEYLAERLRAGHLGLRTPADRVVGAGGPVTASSSPGQVTPLVVTVPLDDSGAGTGGTS
jgi:hypothetical protein